VNLATGDAATVCYRGGGGGGDFAKAAASFLGKISSLSLSPRVREKETIRIGRALIFFG